MIDTAGFNLYKCLAFFAVICKVTLWLHRLNTLGLTHISLCFVFIILMHTHVFIIDLRVNV